MQNFRIKDYYKRFRNNGKTASVALVNAKDSMQAGRKLYDIKTRATIEYNPETKEGYRWIENASAGLRLVGYADKVATRIQHKGWYTDDDGEVLRGVVYQLPARKGKPQYISGYADPYNDDCALLDFTHIHNDKIQAAYAADRIAELAAEKERDYKEAYRAGAMYSDALQIVKDNRVQCIGLIAAIRIERNRQAPKIICDTLRAQVQRHIAAIKSAREQARRLYDDYAHLKEARKHLLDAFNDGAGVAI